MKIAVQIGTNDARDEIFPRISKSGYDKIYLIEPHVKCNDSIRQVYAGENYEIINAAITIYPDMKETELYLFSDNGQHDSLLFRKEHYWRDEKETIETITVPCMTFMQFCEQKGITEIDNLFIDTEGLDSQIVQSIDFDCVSIRKIRWERWIHSDDDENNRYRSGRDIEVRTIADLIKKGYDVKKEDDANFIAIKHPDMKTLPWIDIKDKDHIFESIKYLPDNPVIIEAGTCAAEDTLLFIKTLPSSTIHTFEPNRSLFQISVENIKRVHGDYDLPVIGRKIAWTRAGIYIYQCALTNALTEVTFYESEFPHTSSLYENNFQNIKVPETVLTSLDVKKQEDLKIWPETPVVAQGTDIDSWAKMNGVDRVDYLWLDVEGAELKILQGAKEMLPKMSVISLELNFQEFRKGGALFNEVYDYLFTKGFEIKAIWQAHENWQANGIFVRR